MYVASYQLQLPVGSYTSYEIYSSYTSYPRYASCILRLTISDSHNQLHIYKRFSQLNKIFSLKSVLTSVVIPMKSVNQKGCIPEEQWIPVQAILVQNTRCIINDDFRCQICKIVYKDKQGRVNRKTLYFMVVQIFIEQLSKFFLDKYPQDKR